VSARIAASVVGLALLAAAPAEPQSAPGLLVRIYDVADDMRFLPELAPGQLPNVVRVVPTLELRSDRGDFQPLEDRIYTEVTGWLTIEQAGSYAFRLLSDDGARLWIDARLVIDHDGLHGPEPREGTIELAAGRHTLRVVHFENLGGEHLELQWRRSAPGVESESHLIPPRLLSHAADEPRATAPGKKRIIPPLRRGRPGDGTPLGRPHPALRPLEAGGEGQVPQALDWLRSGRLRVMGRPAQPAVWPPWAWLPAPPPGSDYLAVHRLPVAEFRGQYLIEASAGDSLRLYVDEHEGGSQGCVFRFGQVRPPFGTRGTQTFEMRAVRAMGNGFEIEFTEPLDPRCGWDAESYYIEQWPFGPAATPTGAEPGTSATGQGAAPREHGASAPGHPPRRDGIRYPVKSASVSPDRKKVFLEIENLKESHVVYIRLLPPCVSEDGELPWGTEAWYTLNVIPTERSGEVLPPPPAEPQNFLTDEERAAGWRLLFDGRTTAGWRGYRKDHFPEGWVVKDGCLVRVGPGGDICTVEQFDDFELKLEWRISAGGNSGIFFRVSEQYRWPWESGPEMQVLDNAEHPDGRNPKTSAGANYGLHAPLRDVTRPVGFFNQVRIVADGPHVEYWLNGVKVVSYELGSPQWQALVASSKFAKMPHYGRVHKGHIVLQDHGDKVWYRNIKIRKLH